MGICRTICFWVGEIVELLKVVWDQDEPSIQGDVKVHEYGNVTNKGWKGPQYALYKGKSGGVKPVKPGKTPPAHCKPLEVVVWSEAFVMWGSDGKMLQPQARKLKKHVVEQLAD